MADVILLGKQAAFVDAWMANELAPPDQKLTHREIALRAGVSGSSADSYCARALQVPAVQAVIAERKRALISNVEALAALGVDAKRILTEWAQIAVADPSEVVKVRRLNCRHCYGIDFAYQWEEAEYAQAYDVAERHGEKMPDCSGGFGWRRVRDPHPDCPHCDGEGEEDVYVADFRKLSPLARRLIAGVKQGKHGIEVQFRDQENALKMLASFMGLLVERKEVSGPNGGPIQTQNVNVTLPADPKEASRAYQLLMEGK